MNSVSHRSFHTVLLSLLLMTLFFPLSSSNRCTTGASSVGLWQWRGGSSEAYSPGATTRTYKRLLSNPNLPSPRHSASSWFLNSTLYTFGGLGAPIINSSTTLNSTTNTDGLLADFWTYSLETNMFSQVLPIRIPFVNVPGFYPIIARRNHLMSADSAHNSMSMQHEQNQIPSQQPGSRKLGVTWVSPMDGTLWLFGGLGYGSSPSRFGYLSDLWQFSPVTNLWTFIGGSEAVNTPDSPNWPGARAASISWSWKHSLFLLGGEGTASTGAATVRNDLWVYNLENSKWTLLTGDSNITRPIAQADINITPRSNSLTWFDPNNFAVWVYGGFGSLDQDTQSLGYLNDLWVYNITTFTWNVISPATSINTPGFVAEASGVTSPNNHPPSRCCSSTWLDDRGRLFFYGGYGFTIEQTNQDNLTPDYVNDLWYLDFDPNFRDRPWAWVSGGTASAPVWGELDTTAPLISPGSRAGSPTFWDSVSQTAWIFSGIGVSPYFSDYYPAYYQDIWSFILPNQTLTPPVSTRIPTPGSEKQVLSGSSITLIIVWVIVGVELILLLLFSAIAFRRRKQGFVGNYFVKSDASTFAVEIPSISASETSSKGASPNAFSSQDEHVIIPLKSSPTIPAGSRRKRGSDKKTANLRGDGYSVFYDPPSSGTSTSSDKRKLNNSGSQNNSSSSTPESTGTKLQKKSNSSPGSTDNKTDMNLTTAHFDFGIQKKDLEFGIIIGKGSSGTIYSGKWLGQRVAIKQLATHALVGEREGALSEARMVSNLRPHPHVIRIYGICVTKSNVFIVMSRMHSSLDKLIYHVQRTKYLSTARVYRICIGIVSGMIHLESQNICHRDLAARNVCLTKNGKPCITDFGMSRKLTYTASSGETMTQMGPVAWMAPECFLQKYSAKSDVWSFGVLLYEIITGTIPHKGADLLQLAAAIRDHGITPGPIPSTAEPCFVYLLQLCWKFDPNERPTFQEISKILHAGQSKYNHDHNHPSEPYENEGTNEDISSFSSKTPSPSTTMDQYEPPIISSQSSSRLAAPFIIKEPSNAQNGDYVSGFN